MAGNLGEAGGLIKAKLMAYNLAPGVLTPSQIAERSLLKIWLAELEK